MGSGSNASAFEALDRWMEFLQRVPELAEEAAPLIAKELETQLRENIAAGRNPYGDPWPLKKDGSKPLVNAMKAITVKAVGTVILIVLEGVEVMHHVGNARGYHGGSVRQGGFRRTIIPTGELPGPFRGRIRSALTETWQHLRHTEKGRRK